jgi:NAD(P)-dependent dehydrogenase (short-subunit alcohol dehydrogenase family)
MRDTLTYSSDDWALILGASSGFGAAAARELARRGLRIFGVHFDRKATLHLAEEVQRDVESAGSKAVFFNINAADPDRRAEAIEEMKRHVEGEGMVRVFLHSIAFATLKPYIGFEAKEAVSQRQMEMTLDVMANSLVYWAQDLVAAGLMRDEGRIYAMSSKGGERVWPTYGPTSAAKAALESHIRQLALELAPHGITANAIRAGVTDTPALRKIPGSEEMIEWAVRANPYRRLTTPEDVARSIGVLAHPDTAWLTGNVLGIDGGEGIAG